MAKKKFYITTSIAYTNAPPHVGFAQELIQADVIARYHRLLGKDVFFLTGTDEYGQKNVQAAEKAGKSPQDFVDEISSRFKELTKSLNLTNDDFIRTTDQKRHWPTVKRVWSELKEKGDIYKKKYKGLYCVGCEAFLKEKDLVDKKCPNHDKEPEIIEEENYFFKLSKYSSQIKKEIEQNKIRIVPHVRKNEILSFIQRGIEDVSVSRSKKNLQWGIPVPNDPNQIIYIWFEALLNYLFPKKWPADVHCVGKDIFRFHVLLWPAILIALRMERPKSILVHGFITVDGQKMSKSLGNVVDPFGLVKKYGADAVRYFLLAEIPSTEDGDFTYERFRERYNADLANGIGNLLARVITLAEKANIKKEELQKQLQAESDIVLNIERRSQKALDNFKFNEAISIIWELVGWCDKRIEKEKPWETKDKKVIHNLLFVLFCIARMLQPFLPDTSSEIFKQLGAKLTDKKWKLNIKKGKSLFPRIQ